MAHGHESARPGRVHNRRIRGGGDCRYFADHEDRSALHLPSGLVIGWTTGLCIITESGDARTGWLIAMSVFKPDLLPPLENARNRPIYIYHSPADQLCSYFMAKEAEETLRSQGATVELATYDGGHGWRGTVYDDIRVGINWLEEHQPHD